MALAPSSSAGIHRAKLVSTCRTSANLSKTPGVRRNGSIFSWVYGSITQPGKLPARPTESVGPRYSHVLDSSFLLGSNDWCCALTGPVMDTCCKGDIWTSVIQPPWGARLFVGST